MDESFRDNLAEKTKKVREWAVRRLLEEEEYVVEWGDHDAEFWESSSEAHTSRDPLPLDRYLSGVVPGTKTNAHYYVPKGGEVWNHKMEQVSWIETKFNDFGLNGMSGLISLRKQMHVASRNLCGERSWFNAEIEDTSTKADVLNSDLTDADIAGPSLSLEKTMLELTHWNGDAASAFQSGFGSGGDEWKFRVEGMFILSLALRTAVDAQIATIACTRHDVLAIAENTITALADFREQQADTSFEVATAFAVIGLTLTAAGAGVLAAAYAGAGSMILTKMSQTADPKPDLGGIKGNEFNITGETPEEILDKMSGYLSAVKVDATEQQTKIDNKLTSTYNDAQSNPNGFVIAFEDDEKFSTITPETANNQDALGVRDISANTDELYDAAVEGLPLVAETLIEANNAVASTVFWDHSAFKNDHIDGSLASDMVSSAREPWVALRDLLQDYIGSNAEKIVAAGKLLFSIAEEMGILDEENSDAVDRAIEQLDGDVLDSGQNHTPLDEDSNNEYTTDGNTPIPGDYQDNQAR